MTLNIFYVLVLAWFNFNLIKFYSRNKLFSCRIFGHRSFSYIHGVWCLSSALSARVESRGAKLEDQLPLVMSPVHAHALAQQAQLACMNDTTDDSSIQAPQGLITPSGA